MSNFPRWLIIAIIISVFPLAVGFIVGRAWWMPHQPRFQTSQHSVIAPMLALADIKPGEIVADLGCGDGRIVIEAVKKYGAKGVCVEIVPELLMDARANARLADVSDRIRFIGGDLMDTDFSSLDVVTLFLTPAMNEKLRPVLQKNLRPGSRVISLSHDISGWPATETLIVHAENRDWNIRKWLVR